MAKIPRPSPTARTDGLTGHTPIKQLPLSACEGSRVPPMVFFRDLRKHKF